MITLKNILESILDRQNRHNVGNNIADECLKWVSENYTGKFYVSGTRDGKVLISSKGNVKRKSEYQTLTNDEFLFDTINGHFDIHGMTNLYSLYGCPEKVKGDFKMNGCKYVPDFKYAPKEIGGMLNAKDCISITSLEDVPVANGYYLSYTRINNLVGLPNKVDGDVYVEHCRYLKSLKGAPKYVGGTFDCKDAPLTSLIGAPEKVGVNFSCSGCILLYTLEGAPKEVGLCMFCDYCTLLKSLKGCPKKIGNTIWISHDYDLSDISDIPKDVRVIGIDRCPILKNRNLNI